VFAVKVLEWRAVGSFAGKAFPYPRNKRLEFIGSEKLQEKKGVLEGSRSFNADSLPYAAR
jgi:hypothetical protein